MTSCHSCETPLPDGKVMRMNGYPLCGPCAESHTNEIDALLNVCRAWELSPAELEDLM